ncbi:Aste57867_8454 [Aphanomyces stellatus]|uniref:Aste57867_8454 protein n=1 Tax=Aphanomyces stellatus TaxID=120398 RepID=A0A485KKD8_9STRA|nr:hypothetical protein As57867_008422 [Aphanomyces stellatus]VFT85340.1 Aste57867_8454 [Aphanomyces stellatus]
MPSVHVGPVPDPLAVERRGAPRVSITTIQSLTTIQLTHALRKPTHVVAITKHAISALYFATMCVLYFTTLPQDLRALHAYVPQVVGVVNGCFALLHGHGLFRTWCCRRRRRRHTHRRRRRWISCSSLSRVSPFVRLALPHWINVGCQTYQAYCMSRFLVDRTSAFGFASLVAFNCLVTPWFLFARHKIVRETLVLLLNSFLGFFLSTVFPILVFVRYAVVLVLVNKNYRNDLPFSTVVLMAGQYVVVSSPLDFATKTILQVTSYHALTDLVETLDVGAMAPALHPVGLVSPATTIESWSLSEHFTLELRGAARLVYVGCMCGWGLVVLAVAGVATYHRAPCPDTCLLQVAPWFDTSCQCAHVELNCATRNISSDSIESYLDATQLGQSMFVFDIRRCGLPRGIRLATLAPYTRLFGLHIAFTNMSSWPLDDTSFGLPPSLTSFQIRYSNLTAIPDVLATALPPNLVFLHIESAPITAIPEFIFADWGHVSSLCLNDLLLTTASVAIATMTSLTTLELRGNRLATLSPAWQARVATQLTSLKSLDLSANDLVDGPWQLVKSTLTLDLSSNPIADIPISLDNTLLTKRKIVLDDTPICKGTSPSSMPSSSCQTKCNRLCETNMIGNFRCDWECYSAACRFDGGDCFGYGFA